jgi:predicted nuclease of predicted toxin-antitoxin system
VIFWVDAQLPPGLATWITESFGAQTFALRELGLRDAEDAEIFRRARAAEAVRISKDADFVELVTRLGAPPQLLWVTCGNVSNERLRLLFAATLPTALLRLEANVAIIEIGSATESEAALR